MVAERQGQTAARNILGAEVSDLTPCPSFGPNNMTFRSPMWGMPNDGTNWKLIGSLAARDCAISYYLGGRKLAVATIGRDREALEAEAAFERAIASAA